MSFPVLAALRKRGGSANRGAGGGASGPSRQLIVDMLSLFLDVLLHVNRHLESLAVQYGTAVYAVLFAVIFIETGIVVAPFLPGDSLLFAAGALCAKAAHADGAALQILPLIGALTLAAVLGDNLNYAIGRFLGRRLLRLRLGNRRLVKQQHLERTQAFFARHGTKTIILARFVPIVRTFTPFSAGIGKMDYRGRFLPFDLVGGTVWVSSMVLCGYFLGTLPWVKDHFEIVVLIIVFLSVLPMAVGALRGRRTDRAGEPD